MDDRDRQAIEAIMERAAAITASAAGAGLGFDHRADTFLDGVSVSAAEALYREVRRRQGEHGGRD